MLPCLKQQIVEENEDEIVAGKSLWLDCFYYECVLFRSSMHFNTSKFSTC